MLLRDKIIIELKNRNISISEITDQLNINYGSVRTSLNRNNVTPELLKRISKHLDIAISYWFQNDELTRITEKYSEIHAGIRIEMYLKLHKVRTGDMLNDLGISYNVYQRNIKRDMPHFNFVASISEYLKLPPDFFYRENTDLTVKTNDSEEPKEPYDAQFEGAKYRLLYQEAQKEIELLKKIISLLENK